MEMSALKQAVEAIELPQEANARIRRHLRQQGKALNRKRGKNGFMRPAVLAAVLALCICLPLGGMAMGSSGFFRDIMRGTAVVGTEYLQATEEIDVTAAVRGSMITVTAQWRMPETAPCKYLEQLSLGSYEILDGSGTLVSEGEGSASGILEAGRAEIFLPEEPLEPGTYTLRIHSFLGSKKADQDLVIRGNWECSFAVE